MEQRTLNPIVYPLYQEMILCNHILIAGSTGTGKTTLIDNLIYHALQLEQTPDFYLIDPKRVGLKRYRNISPVKARATEPEDYIAMLTNIVDIMEKRYKEMESYPDDITIYDGNDIFVIIDEGADLVLYHGKEVNPLITRIGNLGRAARIHLIFATQTVLKETCGTLIRNNFDCVVGLKTQSSNQSRVILGVSGTEMLPKVGYGILAMNAALTKYKLPKIPDEELQAMIDFWT